MTAVHMSDWKPVKKTSKRHKGHSFRIKLVGANASLLRRFTPFVEG